METLMLIMFISASLWGCLDEGSLTHEAPMVHFGRYEEWIISKVGQQEDPNRSTDLRFDCSKCFLLGWFCWPLCSLFPVLVTDRSHMKEISFSAHFWCRPNLSTDWTVHLSKCYMLGWRPLTKRETREDNRQMNSNEESGGHCFPKALSWCWTAWEYVKCTGCSLFGAGHSIWFRKWLARLPGQWHWLDFSMQ